MTLEEHNRNLCAVLERARAKGVRFNPDKMRICVTEVPFFGHLITAQGLKADPEKVRALYDLPSPQNREQLENVLGMANYLQKFAPNIAQITGPMRDLLKSDSEFVWERPQN